jgi:hypothetical protein
MIYLRHKQLVFIRICHWFGPALCSLLSNWGLQEGFILGLVKLQDWWFLGWQELNCALFWHCLVFVFCFALQSKPARRLQTRIDRTAGSMISGLPRAQLCTLFALLIGFNGSCLYLFCFALQSRQTFGRHLADIWQTYFQELLWTVCMHSVGSLQSSWKHFADYLPTICTQFRHFTGW